MDDVPEREHGPRFSVRIAAAAVRRHGRVVLAALVGLWELYHWLWVATGWTWPFAGRRHDDAARLTTIVRRSGEPAHVEPARR